MLFQVYLQHLSIIRHNQLLSTSSFDFIEKVIDVNNTDLNKLRVKELKKILNAWGEDCRGCAEKYDFVSKINEVKHKHTEL